MWWLPIGGMCAAIVAALVLLRVNRNEFNDENDRRDE